MAKKYHDKVKFYTQRRRSACITLLGSKCKKCGFDDIRALQVDHVNGGGTKEIRKLGGGAYWNRVIKSVLNNENKYQLLCANCNWIKRFENKELENVGRPKILTI